MNKFVRIFLLLIVLTYVFIFCLFGLDLSDTFYWLNLYDKQLESSMVVLTQEIGSIILCASQNLFDSGLLFFFRIVSFVLYVLAIIIPYVILFSKQERCQYFYILLLTFLLMTPLFIFSPDVLTTISLSLIITIFISWIKGKVDGLWICPLLGSISIISVFLRFPNILVIPISLMLIIYVLYHKKYELKYSICVLSLYVVSLVITYFLLAFLLDCNILMVGIESIFMNNNVGDASSHSTSNLFTRYMQSAITIIVYMSVITLLYQIGKLLNLYKDKKVLSYLLILGIFVFVGYLLMNYVYAGNGYRNFKMLLSAIIILACCNILFVTKESSKGLSMLVVLLISIVQPLGSDTGLHKISAILLCFLPFVYSSLKISLPKLYSLPIFSLFVLLTMYQNTKMFDDKRIHHLNSTVSKVEELTGIHTTKDRACYISNVLSEYDNMKNDSTQIVFYGHRSHIFNYLTGSEDISPSFYSGIEHICDVDKFVSKLKDRNYPVVFCTFYSPEEYSINDINNSYFNVTLMELGYKLHHCDSFDVYYQ